MFGYQNRLVLGLGWLGRVLLEIEGKCSLDWMLLQVSQHPNGLSYSVHECKKVSGLIGIVISWQPGDCSVEAISCNLAYKLDTRHLSRLVLSTTTVF